jgi:hypothetical protein
MVVAMITEDLEDDREKEPTNRSSHGAAPASATQPLTGSAAAGRWSGRSCPIRATDTTDGKEEIQPRIEHGLNTDRMQAGRELVPVNYGDGATKALALEHGEITEQIIGAAFEVYSILGYGFLEINFGRTKVEFKRFVF